MRSKTQSLNVKSQNRGFTFIEVLITITIISVLASMGVASFRGSQEQTRDTERKSDLRQYQLAAENYSTNNGSLYPSRTNSQGVSAATVLCSDLGDFITGCPEDRKNDKDATTYTYLYQSDGDNSGGAAALQWVLWARLERTDNYWVVCADGRTGEKAVSGFSVSGGICPL